MDGSILVALNDIRSQQAKPTKNEKIESDWFLDYVYTHPDVVLLFKASDMVLCVGSGAAYFVKPQAKSHMTGFIILAHISINWIMERKHCSMAQYI